MREEMTFELSDFVSTLAAKCFASFCFFFRGEGMFSVSSLMASDDLE